VVPPIPHRWNLSWPTLGQELGIRPETGRVGHEDTDAVEALQANAAASAHPSRATAPRSVRPSGPVGCRALADQKPCGATCRGPAHWQRGALPEGDDRG